MWGHSTKGSSSSREEGSHQKPNLLVPGSGTSYPPNHENKCLLFRQPSLWYLLQSKLRQQFSLIQQRTEAADTWR